MNTKRLAFLDALIKASPELGVLFLNVSGNPSRMLTDFPVIELLSTKKSFRSFKEFTLSHPLISKIDVIPHFRKKEVWTSFTDGTALHFMFFHDVVSHGLSLLNVKEFLNSATTNEFGMHVPLRPYQFEYLILKVQFEGQSLPDRFKNLFSGLDNQGRTALFQHIQPRYNLILSVIEDLYEPEGHIRYKMMVGLRHSGRNSLLLLTLRLVSQGIFNFFRMFTPKARTLVPDPGQQLLPSADAEILKKATNS